MRRVSPRAGRTLRVVWLLVAALLGCFVLAKRLSAQPAPPVVGGPQVKGRLLPAPPAASSAAPAAAPDDDKKGKGKGKDDKGKDDKNGDYEEPHSYAELPPEGGGGGVPIHKEGTYKSPFAHPHWGTPCKVKVGFLLANLRDYDIKEGTFEADFYLSLTSDRPMPPMDLDLTNGNEADNGKTVIADLPTFKLYRYKGTFFAPPDLHAYPFDTQELTMELEDLDNGTDQIELIPDLEHTNLDVGFQVSGWETAFLQARTLKHYFPDRFDNDDLYYSRYKVTLGIKRFSTSAAFTVFVPAIVIVLISLSGLWLPREELEVRSNASAPMLAAAVLFHFTLMQSLPPTAYLTRADKLMIGVYVSLLLNMVGTWLWFVFDEKHTELIFRLGRIIIPIVTALVMVASITL